MLDIALRFADKSKKIRGLIFFALYYGKLREARTLALQLSCSGRKFYVPTFRSMKMISLGNCVVLRPVFARKKLPPVREIFDLFAADMFRHWGYFDVAIKLYTRLSGHRLSIAYEAACGLADIAILMIKWNNEALEYRKRGAILSSADPVNERLMQENIAPELFRHLSTLSWPDERGALLSLEWSDLFSDKKLKPVGVTTYGLRSKKEFLAMKGFREAVVLGGPSGLPMHQNVCQTVVEASEFTVHVRKIKDGVWSDIERRVEFQEASIIKAETFRLLPNCGTPLISDRWILPQLIHVPIESVPAIIPSLLQVAPDRFMFDASVNELPMIENVSVIGFSKNYYHWLIEDLPRLQLIEKEQSLSNVRLAVSLSISRWQVQLLSMMGIDVRNLERIPLAQGVRVRKSIIPTRLSRDMLPHPDAIRFLRNRLVSEQASPKKGKRLYLARGVQSNGGRAFVNEGTLIRRLKKAGFELIDCGQLSIQEQQKLFRDAEIVAGPAGAAMTNMIFGPPGAKLLHFAADGAAGNAFSGICSLIGQKSFLCLGESWQRATSPNWIHAEYDFRIRPEDMDAALEQVLVD